MHSSLGEYWTHSPMKSSINVNISVAFYRHRDQTTNVLQNAAYTFPNNQIKRKKINRNGFGNAEKKQREFAQQSNDSQTIVLTLFICVFQIRLPPEVNRVLYVRNLPYKITSDEMYDIFGKYGAIRQIRV